MQKIIIWILVLLNILVWIAVVTIDYHKLQIIACNVGQGDAIIIQNGNIQILIDGGPDGKVISCLDKYLPFWDRRLELVVLTHPDSDHISGLIEVFDRFKVQVFLTNDLNNPLFSRDEVKVLQNKVGGTHTKVISPDTSIAIRLGLIYIDILHPKNGWVGKDTNQYSIVNKLVYKDFEAIFAGDIDNQISDEISKNPLLEDVDYIKVPHHGSRQGLTKNLLNAMRPKIAVISVAKNNIYGHPNSEIIDILKDTLILRTDEGGDKIVEIDNKGRIKVLD